MKRLDTSEFIQKARKVHGNWYDYSKVYYKETHATVEIICPKHGIFKQTPAAHLLGRNCPKYSLEKKRGLIRGVARNDTLYTIFDVAFRRWKYLLKRCFPMSEYEKSLCRSYADVGFYEPWLL